MSGLGLYLKEDVSTVATGLQVESDVYLWPQMAGAHPRTLGKARQTLKKMKVSPGT